MAKPTLLTPLPDIVVAESDELGFYTIPYGENFEDPDGGELTFVVEGLGDQTNSAGLWDLPNLNALYATGNVDAIGPITITITASDSEGNSTSDSFEFTSTGDTTPYILDELGSIPDDGLTATLVFRHPIEDYLGDLTNVITLRYNDHYPWPVTSMVVTEDNLSIVITFADPIGNSQSLEYDYDTQGGTYPAIKSADGLNDMATASGKLRNLSSVAAPTDAPVLIDSVVSEDGLTVVATFSENVTSPDTNDFPIFVKRSNTTLSNASTVVVDNVVTITMAAPITYGMDISFDMTETGDEYGTLFGVNATTFTRIESANVDLVTNNSTVNSVPTNISIGFTEIYDTDPVDITLGPLSASDYDTLEADNFVFTLVAGAGDDHNDFFGIKQGKYLYCNDPAGLPVGALSIRLNVNDGFVDFEDTIALTRLVAADYYIPLDDGGSLQDLAESPEGLSSTLDHQKVAIVYNSSTTFPDSKRIAEYYVEQRGLNPDLLYPYDFGPTNPTNWNTASNASGDAFDMVTEFSAWCIAKGVRGVVVSINTPERLTYDSHPPRNGPAIVNFVTVLGACHWVVKRGTLFYDYDGTSALPNTTVETKYDDVSGGENQTRINNATYWFDDKVDTVRGMDGAHNRAYVPTLHDLARAENPFDQNGLLIMPSGRLGIKSGKGWVDNYDNTKRIIDDALIAEARGWEHNKNLQINGNHKHRVDNMTGVTSAILAVHLDRAGWNVKGTLFEPQRSSYLGGNVFDDSFTDATNLKDLYITFGVPHTDYSPIDLKAGTVAPPQPNFCSYGNMLTNDGDDVDDWWDSFDWEVGSWHMIETSSPGNTLQRAVVAGAVGGVAGNIEPYTPNVKFYPGMMWAAVGGLSLMEGYWFAMQERVTASFFVAGDPLYCPYKRLPPVVVPPVVITGKRPRYFSYRDNPFRDY